MSTTLSLPAVRPIPIGQLQESPTNPRKSFSEEKLRELAESIRSLGLIQPIIVRPIDQDLFEVVAGARRFRAAKLAGLEEVLAHVKELTDEQVIELQLIENAQRQDVHPYEEAAAYKALLHLTSPQYDIASIAARIGKSVSHVHQRLTLCNLIPEAAEMFMENRFTAGHAVLIARLPTEQQAQALAATFRDNYATKTKQTVPVRELAQWIREQLTLMLDEVTFDREDATLVPEAGSCSTCPKCTGFNQALWDDFKEDRCLDAECYNGKLKEHIARQLQNNSNLIQISAYYSTTDKNTLTRDRYTVIEQPKDGTEPSRSAERTCGTRNSGHRSGRWKTRRSPECLRRHCMPDSQCANQPYNGRRAQTTTAAMEAGTRAARESPSTQPPTLRCCSEEGTCHSQTRGSRDGCAGIYREPLNRRLRSIG